MYDFGYVCEGERVADGHVCMCMGGDGAGLQGMERCLKAQRAQRRVRHWARLWPRRARRSSSFALDVRDVMDTLATACVCACVYACMCVGVYVCVFACGRARVCELCVG